jgi:ribosomal protein L16 Arg81 hydroxylase
MTESHGFNLLTTQNASIEAAWGVRTTPVPVAPSFLTSVELVAIDRLLATEGLRPPYISFARNGKQVPDREATVGAVPSADQDAGQLDGTKARALVADGATVMLYQAHRWIGSLGEIAARLSSALRAHCDVTVFHTPAHNPGLAWHRDGQHVIAVQTAGSKEWHVERNAPTNWWATGALASDGPGTEVTHLTLRRGEALYMPPGVAHTARATNETSTHVSFVIQEPETKDLMLAVFERALQDVRTRLEAGPIAERGTRATAVARELATAIRDLDVDELLSVVEEDAMETGQSPTSRQSLPLGMR